MFQGYGLTEAAPVISANWPFTSSDPRAGWPRGIELRIRDDAGRELPAGETGEIVIRGENVMAGYWKNEKASREAIRGGWLYTGRSRLSRRRRVPVRHGPDEEPPHRQRRREIQPGRHRGGDGRKLAVHRPAHALQRPVAVHRRPPRPEQGSAPAAALRAGSVLPRTREGQDAALEVLQAAIDEFREGGIRGGLFPPRWLPSAVAVLGEGFTEQNRFLNSTLKMVRGRITDFYRSRIDHLFLPEARDIRNPQNRTIVGRFNEDG